jgi:Flp pilus assembly protein TadG
LVEFALILPVFLLMIVAMVELGMVVHDYISVAEAARAGARAAAVGKDDQDVEDAAKDAAPSIDRALLTVKIAPKGKAARPVGSTVTVTVDYLVTVPQPTIPSLTGEDYKILPETVAVSGKTAMRVEN